MKNKQLLSLLGCSLAALPSMVVAQQKVDKRPNILFILSDDHARTAVSAYGGINAKLAPTPNIDAIGHNGAIMENMLCTNSISGPSRACLLTGKYSTTHGFYQNEGGIVFDNTQQQYQKILRENGYTTALFGKWDVYKRQVLGSCLQYKRKEEKRERLCYPANHQLCTGMVGKPA